jgi:hypothetical protein
MKLNQRREFASRIERRKEPISESFAVLEEPAMHCCTPQRRPELTHRNLALLRLEEPVAQMYSQNVIQTCERESKKEKSSG